MIKHKSTNLFPIGIGTWGLGGFAQENNVLNIIYQPLRRNRTTQRNWPLLATLARKYDVSQNQVILSWILSKGYLPLVKSENVEHINENLSAIELELSSKDIKKLDEFTPPNYIAPKVDWYGTTKGINITQLSNIFDN